MKFVVTMEFEVGETPEDVKERFSGAGKWELTDPDGYRQCFSDKPVRTYFHLTFLGILRPAHRNYLRVK